MKNYISINGQRIELTDEQAAQIKASFQMYPVEAYCWTATPESAQPHDDPNWVVCVSSSG